MNTDKDMQVLRNASGKYVFWAINIALPLAMMLFTLSGVLNVLLAKRFAELDGISLGQLAGTWLDGVNISATYSGAFLKANERWSTALLQFALAYLFFLPIWIAKNREIARNRRLLTRIGK